MATKKKLKKITSITPARKKRAERIVATLKELFPEAHIALVYKSNWELLVAVELSAQCTDKKVNEVTARLFAKYPTLSDYVWAKRSDFEKDIHETGFFRNKAKNILAAAKLVDEKFGGSIPNTMQEMLTIPGVARKTANVVLGNAYGIIDGIAVDTHVKRFAQKFDLTDYSDSKVIERDLMMLIPKKEWFDLTYRLIEYGRKVCVARKHDCKEHPLTKIFPAAKNIWPRAR